MEKLEYWNQLKQPPAESLKTIQAGRLKGMTDIKPQWRIQVMTEVFGPCGDGWKYTIERLWTEIAANGEVVAFAQINLWARMGDAYGDPIPGIGGSMLVAKESKGMHSSDEAYKMAVTDALSVAMKSLGVAADIYMGNWNGTKYKDEQPAPAPIPEISPNALKAMDDCGQSVEALEVKREEWRSKGMPSKYIEAIQTRIDGIKQNPNS